MAPRVSRRLVGWVRRHGTQVRHFVVSITAFGFCDTAAFQWHAWAGFLAVGISVLLVDHAVDGKPPHQGTP